MTRRVCAGCHSEIGNGNYLGCMGAHFHPKCFRCHSCGYPITEHEVVLFIFGSKRTLSLAFQISFSFIESC